MLHILKINKHQERARVDKTAEELESLYPVGVNARGIAAVENSMIIPPK